MMGLSLSVSMAAVGGEGLHVKVRHRYRRGVVQATGQHIGKIKRSVAATLGMTHADQLSAEGMNCRLAEIGAGAFGRESQQQEGPARIDCAQIIPDGRLERSVRQWPGKHGLHGIAVYYGGHFPG